MTMDKEAIAANNKLLEKRKAIQQSTPLTELTEPLEEIIGRINNIITFPADDSPEVKDTWPLKQYGVSRAYSMCTFESFQNNAKLVDALKGKSDESLLLFGNTGCGKTHLAVAILQDNPPGYFISVPELLLRIRSSFSGGDQSEIELIDSFTAWPLLILDDLGAEKTSEFAITTLYLIIDRRIRDMKKTIITTNLKPKEIEEIFGARIASRLAGMKNIEIKMPDYRKKRP